MPASLVRRALPKSLSEPGVIACEIGPGGSIRAPAIGWIGLTGGNFAGAPSLPRNVRLFESFTLLRIAPVHQPGYSSVSASASHSFVQDPKTASPGISPRGRLLPHPPDGPFA